MSAENITKAKYEVAIAERDQARQQAFELRTRVQTLEIDLAWANRRAEGYRKNWDATSNEVRRLMRLIRTMERPVGRKR